MANLFWGVSDALDLYGEYINASKQKTQLIARKDSTQEAKDSSEIGEGREDLEDNSKAGINENKILDETADGNVEKDITSCHSSEEKDHTESDDMESKQGVGQNDKIEKNGVGFGNSENGISMDEKKKDENSKQQQFEISKEKTNDTKEVRKTETSIEKYKDLEINNESAETSKKSMQNSTNHKEMNECDKSNESGNDQFQGLKANQNDLEINIQSADEVDHSTTNTETMIPKTKIEKIQNLKNEFVNIENKSENSKEIENENDCTERQNAGEDDPAVSGVDPNPNNDASSVNDETETNEGKPKVLNILIFGGGDPRHIIKTIAKRYTHYSGEGTASTIPILKFYVIEGCVEIIARNIVLLNIALERPESISLRNKVHLFMDIYGNSLLRPSSHQYLISKSKSLLKMVTNADVLGNFIHINKLKYRELDNLQDAFEFWQPKPGYIFNIKDYWMSRLRQLFAVRYDVREGVFDWDLSMSLKSRGGEQICSQEYRYWRETGIAFTYPEYEQCKPNKTLSAGLVRNGQRYVHRGYVGDIQTGPFCTFGLRSTEERMHHSAHGENDYRATDITERNLLEYFYEIQNGSAYVHNKELSNKYGSVRFQMGERLIHNECDMDDISAYDQPWIDIEGIEVHFLPLCEVQKIGKGEDKWDGFFNVAFIGYKFFDFLTISFPKVMRENSLLILETNLRSVEPKHRISEFETDLHNYARESKLLSVLNYKAINSQNSILKFWKPEKSVQDNMNIDHEN